MMCISQQTSRIERGKKRRMSRFGDLNSQRNTCIRQCLTSYLVDDTIDMVCQYAKQRRVIVLGGQAHDISRQSVIVWFDPSTEEWETSTRGWKDSRIVAGGAAVGDTLYLSGGFCAGDGSAQFHQSLHLSTWLWTPLADPPGGGMHSHISVMSPTGEDLVVLGGRVICEAHDYSKTELVHWYNIERDAWSRKSPTNHGHDAFTGVTCGPYIYALGGIVTKRVERYNMANDSWSDCAPLLSERGGAAATAIDNKFIVVCGGTDRYSKGLCSCEAYSTALDRWTPIANMLLARVHAMAVFVDGHVMVCGGSARIMDESLSSSAEIYNWKTDVWRFAPPMPVPRRRGIAVVV